MIDAWAILVRLKVLMRCWPPVINRHVWETKTVDLLPPQWDKFVLREFCEIQVSVPVNTAIISTNIFPLFLLLLCLLKYFFSLFYLYDSKDIYTFFQIENKNMCHLTYWTRNKMTQPKNSIELRYHQKDNYLKLKKSQI